MFFASQQLAKYAADCTHAAHRVESARTIREVRDWGRVHPPSLVSALKHTVPEHRRLAASRERRAEALVLEHLAELESLLKAGDTEAYKDRLGQLRQDEWIFLRGEHPRLLQQIERKVATIEHLLGPTRVQRDRENG